MNFLKYHALGNDYLVISPQDAPDGLTPERIRRICDRNYGVGSDGILVGDSPHPRVYGTFPRYLGRYVRELGILSWEGCVRKMTGMSAARIGLVDRGLLKVGLRADITMFDPQTVRDTATFEQPKQFPEGLPYVLVNGRVVKDQGEHTGVLAGRALRRGRVTV
jgi:N-acyl-D-amino-acid deacylase